MADIVLMPKDWLETPEVIINELSSIQAGDIEVDASQCDFMGAQVAQILLAASLTAQKRDGALKMRNVSPKLSEEIDLLGLSDALTSSESTQ